MAHNIVHNLVTFDHEYYWKICVTNTLENKKTNNRGMDTWTKDTK